MMDKALQVPNGARYYRCALQVNPYPYLIRHGKLTPFKDEETYNTAMVKACLDAGVEVIAVADHYRIKTSAGLIGAAQEAGLIVLPGFEAVTHEGVHLLCLFDQDTELDRIDRIIGDCGIHNDDEASPLGRYSVTDLLDEANRWGAACIAAHMAAEQGGLLRVLKGKARAQAWRHSRLLAGSLPGPITDAPADLRPILEQKDREYRRTHPLTVLNSQDASAPEDFAKPGICCWIKMGQVSVQALHQAFLDPQSRVRLDTDTAPENHFELIAIGWEGGFLDLQCIHFNENLNVLVGGRGAGKSSIIESLRYALGLDPLGDDMKKVHEGFLKHVLGHGTKVSLLVRSHTPSRRDYLIEGIVPNRPVVKEATGSVLPLSPRDVLPNVEIYGQHEIAELAKSPSKLTSLLQRFVELGSTQERKADLRRQLALSRQTLQGLEQECSTVMEKLSELPKIEETLRRYRELGVEAKLRDQSLLVKEQVFLQTASARLEPLKKATKALRTAGTIDKDFASDDHLSELPAREILAEVRAALNLAETAATAAVDTVGQALQQAEKDLGEIRGRWDSRRIAVEEALAKILRELQKEKIDGSEFIKLQTQIENLKPLKNRLSTLEAETILESKKREKLLAQWDEVKRQEYEAYEKAAKRVTRKLRDKVRVCVEYEGDKEPLTSYLRETIGGRLGEAMEALRSASTFSLSGLAAAAQNGPGALVAEYGMTSGQAARLSGASRSIWLQVEELDLPHTTTVELNVAGDDQAPEWKELDRLSTGQKATAILLLLLLESDAPLVVDQPEDDLDNRFVSEVVVPKMREEKRRRQFVFATHNANIPVLGDAEMIAGLFPSGEADSGQAVIPREMVGSLDSQPVRELIETLLEGGKNAFETRRRKYGF